MSTHHKCREILAELGKEGSLIYWDMPFPPKTPLDKCLADVLEDEVEDKYYLSDKMLNCFQVHGERHNKKGNGFAMKPKGKNEIANCIGTKAGTRATDNFIRDLTQVGNIDTKGHNSLWGRVYDPQGIAPTQNAKGGGAGAKTGLFVVPHGNNKGGWRLTDVCPSITTSSWQHNNFIKPKEKIRRLTPRECSRVQGDFSDKFKFGDASDTKLYEFIGNAMDISTTRNLINQILKHCEDIEWNEPRNTKYERNTKTQHTLF